MAEQPLWDKGGASIDERLMRFLAGEDVRLDQHLLPYDIRASIAHVNGLHRIGILDGKETKALVAALESLRQLVAAGQFVLDDRYEDGHSAIEAHLTEQLGDIGRKVHTGRSRNDQVLVATRLYLRDQLDRLTALALDTAEMFLERAKADAATPMPGYTHLQRAVPSTVGLWCAAFTESFSDIAALAQGMRRWIDASPLGTAAGYGVNLDLDRQGVADELGFTRVQINAMYAQNSRGRFELGAMHALHQALLEVRRFAWDLSLFTTEEFGFVALPQRFTTGSSIMPNKRNPDVVELLRASCGVVEGAVAELAAVLSLPSGYQRDLQATKEPMIRAFSRGLAALAIVPDLVASMEFDRPRMREAITPAMFATDRAIQLAAEGVPFREAYRQVGREIEAMRDLPIEQSIAQRTSLGGSGNLGLDVLRQRLDSLRA
ncbi:MAG: argininosuccinate lyase [Phycisphaerales bacterium]|nr:argininosuccinate lyase [Phycisphaerales bacterium]